MEKPFRYRIVQFVQNIYFVDRPGVESLKDVEAFPRAGSLDILLPCKDGATQTASVPWDKIKVAIRVEKAAN